MLVLTRRPNQTTFLDFSEMTDAELLALRGKPIQLTVVEVRGDKVKLGFEAPRPVKIDRSEVFAEKNAAVHLHGPAMVAPFS